MNMYLNGRRALLGALAVSALTLGAVEISYSWHGGYGHGYRGGYHGYYHGYRGYNRGGWYGVGYRGGYYAPGYRNVWVGRVGCAWVPAHRNRFGQYIPGHRAC